MQSTNAIVAVCCHAAVVVVVLGNCDIGVSNCCGIILRDDDDDGDNDGLVVVVVIAGGRRRKRREAERPQPAAGADRTKRCRHAPPGGDPPTPPWRCSMAAKILWIYTIRLLSGIHV